MFRKPVDPVTNRVLNHGIVALKLSNIQKHLIYDVNHRLRAAITGRQRLRPIEIRKFVIHQIENFRDPATPAVNRLFHVADTEKRTQRITHLRFPNLRNATCKRMDDVPLHQRSILKLIQ